MFEKIWKMCIAILLLLTAKATKTTSTTTTTLEKIVMNDSSEGQLVKSQQQAG